MRFAKEDLLVRWLTCWWLWLSLAVISSHVFVPSSAEWPGLNEGSRRTAFASNQDQRARIKHTWSSSSFLCRPPFLNIFPLKHSHIQKNGKRQRGPETCSSWSSRSDIRLSNSRRQTHLFSAEDPKSPMVPSVPEEESDLEARDDLEDVDFNVTSTVETLTLSLNASEADTPQNMAVNATVAVSVSAASEDAESSKSVAVSATPNVDLSLDREYDWTKKTYAILSGATVLVCMIGGGRGGAVGSLATMLGAAGGFGLVGLVAALCQEAHQKGRLGSATYQRLNVGMAVAGFPLATLAGVRGYRAGRRLQAATGKSTGSEASSFLERTNAELMRALTASTGSPRRARMYRNCLLLVYAGITNQLLSAVFDLRVRWNCLWFAQCKS
jgi:hypothetical protein